MEFLLPITYFSFAKFDSEILFKESDPISLQSMIRCLIIDLLL